MPIEDLKQSTHDSGIRLPESFHSRYDPLREAVRHVETCLDGKHPSLVFILGGGINYIGAAIATILPFARTVLLQPSDLFDNVEVSQTDFRWSPSSQSSLDEVIRASLQGEYIAGGVSIIEWNPVVKIYYENSQIIKRELKMALEISSSQSATSSFWAYRWLKNSIRFAMNVTQQVSLKPSRATIVLACAGPGLSAYYDTIRNSRARMQLWSLASASIALRQHGLEPDLILATDPGFWNSHHLYDSQNKQAPIALTPSAYAPSSVLENSAILPLYTGLEFERIALDAIDVKACIVEASGSSAGTALSLALTSTDASIDIIGLDLAAYGCVDHAAPYAFDILDTIVSKHSVPELTLKLSRVYEAFSASVHPWRSSRQFTTYSQTIRVPVEQRHRVFRFSDSPIELDMARAELPLHTMIGMPMSEPCFFSAAISMDVDSRRDKLKLGLTAYIDGALADASRSIEEHRPMHFNSALLYRALAGKRSAETIAKAARGCATHSALLSLDGIARKNLEELIKI